MGVHDIQEGHLRGLLAHQVVGKGDWFPVSQRDLVLERIDDELADIVVFQLYAVLVRESPPFCGRIHAGRKSQHGVQEWLQFPDSSERVLHPLHGRHRLLGWIFVGRRVAGIPFGRADLEDLMLLVEHAGVVFENALLYEDVRVRKTLAETVLQSIPTGIVAVDAERRVRGINRAAETIPDLKEEEIVGRRSGELGSRMADILRACLDHGDSDEPLEWVDPLTKCSLSILTRRLTAGGDDLCAVAIVRDMTREAFLRERQQRLERGTFWTELAAAISHEVRNPLVAISTFAQLLPEKYDDPDFRTEFSKLVSQEVRRLSDLIDQIDSFANPPPLQFKPVRMDSVLRKAVETAIAMAEPNGCRIETSQKGTCVSVSARPKRSAPRGAF